MRKLDNWSSAIAMMWGVGAGVAGISFALTLDPFLVMRLFLGWCGVCGILFTVVIVYHQGKIRTYEQSDRENAIAKDRLALLTRARALGSQIGDRDAFTEKKNGQRRIDVAGVDHAVNNNLDIAQGRIEKSLEADSSSSESPDPTSRGTADSALSSSDSQPYYTNGQITGPFDPYTSWEYVKSHPNSAIKGIPYKFRNASLPVGQEYAKAQAERPERVDDTLP